MAESKPVEGGKKSTKKVILIVVFILLLLAGGGAAYYFLIFKPAESGQETGIKPEAKQEEAKDTKVEQPEQEQYYALDAPLIVNFPPGSSARIIKVAVTVLVKDEPSVEVLKKHEPMIRNNLLMAISSVGADSVKTLEGKQALRALMLSEIGKVMEKMAGKNTAIDLYFTEFVMQ